MPTPARSTHLPLTPHPSSGSSHDLISHLVTCYSRLRSALPSPPLEWKVYESWDFLSVLLYEVDDGRIKTDDKIILTQHTGKTGSKIKTENISGPRSRPGSPSGQYPPLPPRVTTLPSPGARPVWTSVSVKPACDFLQAWALCTQHEFRPCRCL